MFDLNTLELSDQAFDLRLTHPSNGLPLGTDAEPVVISIYGTASDVYRDAVSALQLKQIKRGKKQATPAETKADTVALIVACTAGCKNLKVDGKVPSSAADFTSMYNNLKFSWVLEQVAGGLTDPANFLAQ